MNKHLESEAARLKAALLTPAYNSTQRRQLQSRLLELQRQLTDEQTTANDGKPLGQGDTH